MNSPPITIGSLVDASAPVALRVPASAALKYIRIITPLYVTATCVQTSGASVAVLVSGKLMFRNTGSKYSAPFASICSEYSPVVATSSGLRDQSARRPSDAGLTQASKVKALVRLIDSLAGMRRL